MTSKETDAMWRTRSEQPEALRLADELEMWTLGEPAAIELRRLHAVNTELLEALQKAHPEARQMPQIFINGQRVGGLAGLQAALKELGL